MCYRGTVIALSWCHVYRMYGTACSCALVSVPKHRYRPYPIIDFIGDTTSSRPKNASKIKANLEFHQSSDDFIANASPRAICPFLPFRPNKRRSWWEWTIWWSFALALFLVLLLWGGVDDGKGEWDVNWYIWRKLYTNEGLKVSATIATIATIAKRVFLAERIDDIEIQVYRRFSWLVIKHSWMVLFIVLNDGIVILLDMGRMLIYIYI